MVIFRLETFLYSVSGKNGFELCENSIKLYDFEDNFYEIDFMGNLIAGT